jgi:hypothetical protein
MVSIVMPDLPAEKRIGSISKKFRVVEQPL